VHVQEGNKRRNYLFSQIRSEPESDAIAKTPLASSGQLRPVQLVCLFVYLRQSITSIFGPLDLLDLLDINEKALFGLFLAS